MNCSHELPYHGLESTRLRLGLREPNIIRVLPWFFHSIFFSRFWWLFFTVWIVINWWASNRVAIFRIFRWKAHDSKRRGPTVHTSPLRRYNTVYPKHLLIFMIILTPYCTYNRWSYSYHYCGYYWRIHFNYITYLLLNVYCFCYYGNIDSLINYISLMADISNICENMSYDINRPFLTGDLNDDPNKGRFFKEYSNLVDFLNIILTWSIFFIEYSNLVDFSKNILTW